MPTYVYRREDGSTFEIEQRITESALEVCPETGQTVERVITGAGLIFKGSGFYLTDYARKSEKAASSSDAKGSEESTSSKETTTTKTSEKSEKASTSNGKAESNSKSSE